MMVKFTVITVLLLNILHCFAQSVTNACLLPCIDGTFLIYNANKNRCLGDNLQQLIACNPQNRKQQFRWTSEDRIFNVEQKKCLGTGSISEGNKLQWYICDATSNLQKWECQSDSLFGLKNESLYLSVQGGSLLTLSKDPGDKGKWTIHGTTDSVCSQPYEETYTIKGNAFGRPCHFPFRFKNKWYTECTTEGSSKSRLWCSIERDYEAHELWGYCPTRQKDDFWIKNPLTDVYYQLNEESALTWYQARKSCQQQGGDLLSVTEPHEQTFVSAVIFLKHNIDIIHLGLTHKTGTVLWTGLNSLDASGGWRWINGQPLRYLKWLSGQPSSVPGHSCGVISQLYGSEWSTAVCSERHGYICQRGLSTPTVPPVVHTGSCYSPWIPYSDHCYLLSRTKRTWLDARDACRREGGDLLSILSVEEQSFAISQLGYTKTDELWIGLNDLKTAMLFEWSDHSSVPIALWDVNEPSHNVALKEDCVLMRGQEGKWADQICQNKNGYVCKKKNHSAPSTNDTVVTSPGCKPGWIRYGYYCYLAGSETKTFEEAKQMCEKAGSYLADINNRIENAFLVSLIGARPEKHFWIGLSNQKNRHFFEWTNTSKVAFTHFSAGMPGGKQGCVAMTTGVLPGLWDVLSCTNQEKYICKQKAEGVGTTSAPPTTPVVSCSEGWHPLKNRHFCAKLFSVERKQQKTWSEALSFCREVGGDLLSIHSDDDINRESIMYSSAAWIGYSIQDAAVGFTWSDGSASSYENWEEGEPNDLNNLEKCVTIRIRWWRHKGQWNDLQCEDKADWLCQIEKGVTPKEVEITERTYNTTDDGWIIFKDNQYYTHRGTSVSMEEARSFCKHRHGDLVVINDEEERIFVWHQAVISYDDVYIGMIVDLDKSVMWMDGSPVVFQAWEQNHPAFLNNEERCVKMTRSQGLWESVNCGDYENFICKRSGSVPVNTTAAPTQAPKGGCAPDWIKFQDKCYKVELEPKTWTDARTYCIESGGNLASVSYALQQAFLNTKMAHDITPDLWIGFSNLAGRRFKWTDGSPVKFTNWLTESSEFYGMENMCTAMGGSQTRKQLGKWIKKDCNDTIGFICSRGLDRVIVPSTTEMPKTFIKIGNASYMVVQTNLTWKDAQQQCESEGAKLASIRDIFSQSYIDLQTHKLKQPLWIGLNSMETHGYFLWIDNWHLNMERWAPYEPKKGRPCVYVDVDGTWKTAHCNQTYYSLCKKSTEVAPTPPAQYPGMCPEETDEEESVMSWMPFKGHCYAFVTSQESWVTASSICKRRGASLVSIQDPQEAAFLENYVSLIGNNINNFWIGLYRTYLGRWQWLDDSVVDYTNWEESGDHSEIDEEYFYFGHGERNCALITANTKQWRKRHCRYSEAMFICKTAKVIQPTTAEDRKEAVSNRAYAAGVSVVVVIVVLSLLAGLAYIYSRTSKRQVIIPSLVNPMYCTTVSPLAEDKDNKCLMNSMDE
ncbi:hypothetical protein NFI96_027557 [Prochilodus magdalenae]|nr:hypothetical protein NFI96_027557 [Prochilodus magdalenae]